MTKDYLSIINDVEGGKIAPLYLLHGEEPYFIDKITQALESIVPPESRDFNLSLLYGEEVSPQVILDHCKQYPMMAERRVVIVKEAQALKGLAQLERYVDHLVPTTVLVIAHKHKKLDGRLAFVKKAKKSSVVFESKSLYDNQVEKWIIDQLKTRRIRSEPHVPSLLSQHLGRDLAKIEGELDKVETNLKEGQILTSSMIERWVGISREFNVFELQKAMSYGQVGKAMTIAQYFSNNIQNHHPLMILASLYQYFQKIMLVGIYRKADQATQLQKLKLGSPYILKEYQAALRFWTGKRVLLAFELLSEYDLKLKGVGNKSTPPGDLLKEMIFRMMTGG